jgi:hypothetical protein
LILVHLLLKVFLALFTLITVLISLKTVVVHRVEGTSLRAVVVVTYRLVVGDVLDSFMLRFVDLPGKFTKKNHRVNQTYNSE